MSTAVPDTNEATGDESQGEKISVPAMREQDIPNEKTVEGIETEKNEVPLRSAPVNSSFIDFLAMDLPEGTDGVNVEDALQSLQNAYSVDPDDTDTDDGQHGLKHTGKPKSMGANDVDEPASQEGRYGMVPDESELCKKCEAKVNDGRGVQFVLENTDITKVLDVGSKVWFEEGEYPRIGKVITRQILYDVVVEYEDLSLQNDTFYTISPEGFKMREVTADEAGRKSDSAGLVTTTVKEKRSYKKRERKPDTDDDRISLSPKKKSARKLKKLQNAKRKHDMKIRNDLATYIGRTVRMKFNDNRYYEAPVTKYHKESNRYAALFPTTDDSKEKLHWFRKQRMMV
jgi:hypothetical protein